MALYKLVKTAWSSFPQVLAGCARNKGVRVHCKTAFPMYCRRQNGRCAPCTLKINARYADAGRGPSAPIYTTQAPSRSCAVHTKHHDRVVKPTWRQNESFPPKYWPCNHATSRNARRRAAGPYTHETSRSYGVVRRTWRQNVRQQRTSRKAPPNGVEQCFPELPA